MTFARRRKSCPPCRSAETHAAGKMHILLVRHGESSNNQIEAELGECHSYYQRRAVDPGLSALGEEQARTHTRIAVNSARMHRTSA